MNAAPSKTAPLKAMFWKECRENARWAVLACLALSLGLAYAWSRLPSGPALPQVWGGENLVLTITTPLIGLALGLLQILPELRRDQWAFLVHRPATRTTLFFGKALPGVCLYLAATVPPLLGLAVWASSPSHVPAPFDFRFTLVGWAAILSGLPFYFAGLLVALRPARWYGSRALPVLTALLAPLMASTSNEFWQVVLVCVLVTATLLAASWGSFLTSGQYDGQTHTARLGLGAALFLGVAVAVLGSVVLSVTVYQSLLPAARSAAPVPTQYEVDTDGNIMRAYYADSTVRYTDVQGKPLPTREQQDSVGTGRQLLTFVDLLNPYLNDRPASRRYSDPQRYVAPLETFLYHSEDTAWFYPYDRGHAVGYSLRTRRIVGYLGPRGFSGTPDGAGRFPEPLVSSEHMNNEASLLHFPHSVILSDTSRQEIKPLWPPSGSAGIDGVCYVAQSDARGRTFGDAIVIAAGHKFHLFTGSGIPLLTTPYVGDAAHYPFVQVGTAPMAQGMMPPRARFFFWYSFNGFGAQSWADAKIVTLSSSGRVLQAVTLPALQSPAPYQPPRAIGLLVPPAGDAFALGQALHDRWFGDAQQRKNWDSLKETGVSGLLLPSALMGLLAAALAWLISRRLGDGRRGRLAWAFGVFWLGGYGVLLLLALRAWPARLPCPDCGRARVVDNENCEHCGAAWARAGRDGTEIFDDIADRAPAAPHSA